VPRAAVSAATARLSEVILSVKNLLKVPHRLMFSLSLRHDGDLSECNNVLTTRQRPTQSVCRVLATFMQYLLSL